MTPKPSSSSAHSTAPRSEDIIAWTIASNTGYTFEAVAWKPRLGLKLNFCQR